MSKYKILFKITGSIAAYKSAAIVSKLVQRGYEVQVVATPSALKFIGHATLEGLTAKQVICDSFEEGKMMSHINLVKWADLTLMAPATANTINKMAAGIADNLVTSLFLAHDQRKPYLIAPAMNTAMLNHPSTRESIFRLKSWGITVLDTGSGRLACGDEGYGKLLEPDEIVRIVGTVLRNINNSDTNINRVLITSGGTREKIDNVRQLINISTGRTGAVIADYFISQGWEVTFMHAMGSQIPGGECEKVIFTDYTSLDTTLNQTLRTNRFDAVIHLAAVSDYSVHSVIVDDKEYKAPYTGKIDSRPDELILRLKKNEKILNRIKKYAMESNPVLIGFKFTDGMDSPSVNDRIVQMQRDSGAEFMVWNDAHFRNGGHQTNFILFGNQDDAPSCFPEAINLAVKLEQILSETINKA